MAEVSARFIKIRDIMHHGLIILVYILKCGDGHTAQRQLPTRIHIGFCANLSPSCLSRCLTMLTHHWRWKHLPGW